YSGEFVRELFRKRGVEYRPSDQGKSDIYLTALPAINSGLVDLLDNKHLLSQLTALERRTARGGRDSVDHPPNAHDDLANAACGALVAAATVAKEPVLLSVCWVWGAEARRERRNAGSIRRGGCDRR